MPKAQSLLALEPRSPNINFGALRTPQAFSLLTNPFSATYLVHQLIQIPRGSLPSPPTAPCTDAICHVVYVFLYKHLCPSRLEPSLFFGCLARSLFISMKSTSAGWMNELWESFRHHTGVVSSSYYLVILFRRNNPPQYKLISEDGEETFKISQRTRDNECRLNQGSYLSKKSYNSLPITPVTTSGQSAFSTHNIHINKQNRVLCSSGKICVDFINGYNTN